MSVTVSQAADDGLLGGAAVESNDAIVDLYGPSLSRRDLAMFLGKPAMQERMAARLAEILADPNFEPELLRRSLAEDPFELAERTGRIGGQPDTENQENGAVGAKGVFSPLAPTAPNVYIKPVRAAREHLCLVDISAKRRNRSDGDQTRTLYSCRKCGPCIQWWRFCKRHKYEWGISGKPEQTVIVCHGLPDDDTASAAAIAVGRAGDGQRLVSLVRNKLTYHWDALIVFTSSLTDKAILNIKRGRDRAGQQCTIETRPVSGAELVADWLPVNDRTPGQHKPCRFVGWGDAMVKEREYEYNDGYIIKAADHPEIPWQHELRIDVETHVYADAPTDTNSKRKAKLRARNRIHIRRWLEGVTLDPDALLSLRTARLDGKRGDWFGCIASGIYDGPKALIIDLAKSLDSDGMLSLDAPDGLRLASSYIADAEAVAA